MHIRGDRLTFIIYWRARMKKLGAVFTIVILILLVAVGMEFAGLLISSPDYFEDSGGRLLACFCFLLAGLGYWFIRRKMHQTVIGILEIIAGLVSNYFQLERLGGRGAYDRIVFIIAGVAVIGHGFKELFEGITTFMKENVVENTATTSQSSVSSAAPTPGRRAPAKGAPKRR
jgi:hypothetical protein